MSTGAKWWVFEESFGPLFTVQMYLLFEDVFIFSFL